MEKCGPILEPLFGGEVPYLLRIYSSHKLNIWIDFDENGTGLHGEGFFGI